MRRGILFLAVFGAALVSCNAIIKKEDIELPKLPLCPPDAVDCDCNPYEDTIGDYITCLNALDSDPDVTYVAPTCSDKLSAEAQLECESTCEDTASDAVGYLLCLREFIKAELDKFGLDKITNKLHKPIIPYPKLPLCPPESTPVDPCSECTCTTGELPVTGEFDTICECDVDAEGQPIDGQCIAVDPCSECTCTTGELPVTGEFDTICECDVDAEGQPIDGQCIAVVEDTCPCDPDLILTYADYITCLEDFYGDGTDLDEYCSTKLSFEAYTECDTTCLVTDTPSEYIGCLVDAIDEYKESYGLSILGKKEKEEKCDPCTDDDCKCDPYKELCPTCPELPVAPAGAGRRMLL